jgi:hypothetical protein
MPKNVICGRAGVSVGVADGVAAGKLGVGEALAIVRVAVALDCGTAVRVLVTVGLRATVAVGVTALG